MTRRSSPLAVLLSRLGAAARRNGWSDAEWARRAGVAKETLCRLRARQDCDLSTLEGLARSVGATVGVVERRSVVSEDGFWPVVVDRTLESRLLDVVDSGSTRVDDWRALGPPFFVAGVATMLASLPMLDRQRYLALAEALHPGATEPRVFECWLARTPLPPSRILPMVLARLRHAA